MEFRGYFFVSSPYALGIGAASFANDAIAERAQIQRKARRRSRKRSRNARKRQIKVELALNCGDIHFKTTY